MALTQPKWPSMSFLKRLLQPDSLRRWKSSFMSGCPVSSLRDRKPTEERIPQPFGSFMVHPSRISKRTQDGGLSPPPPPPQTPPAECLNLAFHRHTMGICRRVAASLWWLSPSVCLPMSTLVPHLLCLVCGPSSQQQQQQQLPAPVTDPSSSSSSSCLSVSQHQQCRIADAHGIKKKDIEGVVFGIHCLEDFFFSHFNPTNGAGSAKLWSPATTGKMSSLILDLNN